MFCRHYWEVARIVAGVVVTVAARIARIVAGVVIRVGFGRSGCRT